jgi:hypothetical protein
MNSIIIGETCLLDKQLRRLGVINAPHGCFDTLLVNLDGIKKIIEDDFKYILNPEYIHNINYNYYPEHNICYDKLINVKYSIDTDDIFSWDVMSFFHTHNSQDLETLKRRIERTKNWFYDNEQTILYYYYRYNIKYNIDKLYEKILDFQKFLNNKFQKNIKILTITNKPDLLKISYKFINPYILTVNFHTKNSWIGIDDNWDAHLDNDLFDIFFKSEIFQDFLK